MLGLGGCMLQLGPGLAASDRGPSSPETLSIPAQADWTDYGTIFEQGELGDWDFQLFGGFCISSVKKNATYFLYYQGASGYRIADDTVTWRAVGAVSSPDGINFAKYDGNPVLAWFPNNSGEEGAVSCGAALDPSGEMVLYYGANTEESATTVNADGRIAVSTDGLQFADEGVVLDQSDPSVWGSGDELFPIVAFEDSGQWFVYYIPNGTPQSRKLGAAWGPSRDQLDFTGPAISGGVNISAWGGAGVVKIGASVYALFLNVASVPSMEVRTVSPSAPDQLSGSVQTYQFPDVGQATVLLDQEVDTWFMYYRVRNSRSYGVMLAPVGSPDTSPPTAPTGVTATPASHQELELTWEPASDSETGIVQYRVFRDGQLLAAVKGWAYRDKGLSELTQHVYEVSAINYHGTEGPRSAPEAIVMPADTAAPKLEHVTASGDATSVEVLFDEPVARSSAEDPNNYAVDQGVWVSAASLGPDARTVTLTTSPHVGHRTYFLSVRDIRDRADSPNTMTAPEARNYLFSTATGLKGSWRLEEATGTMALDTSNFGNDGSSEYPDEVPAVWTSGRIGGALWFDGIHDLVTVEAASSLRILTDGGHTFAAWVRPQSTPPDSAYHNTFYSVITRGFTGLYYDFNQRFKAVVRQADGTEVSVLSSPFVPDTWHHLAMVVDDQGEQLSLYVDGSEVSGSPVAYSGPLTVFGTDDYFIGTSDPLVERWDYRFHGTIDEVRLYDRPIDPWEVQELVANPAFFLLTVMKSGGGEGWVEASPTGIACGQDCSELYPQSTVVTLQASPGAGSLFAGWSGAADCSDGVVSMDGSTTCVATFAPLAGVIFADGLESGDLAAWSGSVP